jgi:mannan endo-1,4-beta-mannosidase
MRLTQGVLLVAALAMFFPTETAAQAGRSVAAPGEFVSVKGRQFVLEGKPYYFVGTNLWYGAYLGSPGATGNRARLVEELDALAKIGVTNLRVLTVSEATELKRAVRPPIMTAPGVLDEELLRGLDFLLAEMARRDMKAVLYLNNFWQWSGGMSQYVAWFNGKPVLDPDVTGQWDAFMENSASFYREPRAQEVFRRVIQQIITRRNSVTGRVYRDDPTIMSWQLANEPRPGSDATERANFVHFVHWIEQTAAFIKALAPKQLVSTGNEGWRGSADDKELFLRAHASAQVDYLTFHLWAPNWSWYDPKHPAATYESAWTKAQDYIDWHIDAAGRLGKPIVLEEFGLNRDNGAFEVAGATGYRDRYFDAIFNLLERRAAAGDAIAGSNFWAWNGSGRTRNADFMWRGGDDFVGDPPQEPQGLYGVFDSDVSTIAVIAQHAARLRALGSPPHVTR